MFLQYWFLMLDLESYSSQWKGTQKCQELFQTVGLPSAAMRAQKRPQARRSCPSPETPTHHILKKTLFIMKNLPVSLPVLQIKCPELWRKQNSLSGQWICFAISKFSILPWLLDISLCWRKQMLLLLDWGKEEHNKMNFRKKLLRPLGKVLRNR